jgi:hypothetical protein
MSEFDRGFLVGFFAVAVALALALALLGIVLLAIGNGS